MLSYPDAGNAYGSFLDIELGDENGIEPAKQINDLNPDIKIFFVSYHENLAYEAIHASAVRFIRKSNIGTDISEATQFIQRNFRA